jgi:hypothetical protein
VELGRASAQRLIHGCFQRNESMRFRSSRLQVDLALHRRIPWLGSHSSLEDHMNLVILGAPSSGRGTHAESLQREFGLTHVASGDLFRSL